MSPTGRSVPGWTLAGSSSNNNNYSRFVRFLQWFPFLLSRVILYLLLDSFANQHRTLCVPRPSISAGARCRTERSHSETFDSRGCRDSAHTKTGCHVRQAIKRDDNQGTQTLSHSRLEQSKRLPPSPPSSSFTLSRSERS